MGKTIGTLAVEDTFEVPVKVAYRSLLGDYVTFKMADKNHADYPSGAITLITDKIVMVGAFDAKEPSNSNADRKNYGNNRYIHSNILQWLNSNAAAGKWYSAKHSVDAPPTTAACNGYNGYDTQAGFLAMLDDNFVAALMDTTVTVAKNTVTDGGNYETIASKMFLASTTEVGLENENGIAEGSKLALFNGNTSRLAYPTAQCVTNTNYTNSSFNASAAWYWWLRTPNSRNSYDAHHIYLSGVLSSLIACDGYGGVRPLCNLLSSILVSDTTNSRGNYEFLWNQPPAISGPDRNLGTFGETFSAPSYSVTDPESDVCNVVERLDGATLRTFTAVLGSTYSAGITDLAWRKVLNGVHTLTVTAEDSEANTSVRTFTFTKAVSEMEARTTEIFPADARPAKLLINAQAKLPSGAVLTVEVCNNANDSSPTWEDVTNAVNTGEIYMFTNKSKTAAEWGVQLRFSGSRGTSGEACSLSGIGGTFG